MVKMRMGQDKVVDALGVKTEGLVVAEAAAVALKHTAIDKYTDGTYFDKMTGSGDGLCRTVRCYCSHMISFIPEVWVVPL
jgi:hypothetical protein